MNWLFEFLFCPVHGLPAMFRSVPGYDTQFWLLTFTAFRDTMVGKWRQLRERCTL